MRFIMIDFDEVMPFKGDSVDEEQRPAMSRLWRNKADSRMLSQDKWWEQPNLTASLRETCATQTKRGCTNGRKEARSWNYGQTPPAH